MIWLTLAILSLLLVFSFYQKPLVGLFLVIFFAPFTGLVIDFSTIDWLQNVNYISNIQAPIADILVLFLGVAVTIKIILAYLKNSDTRKHIQVILEQTGFYYFLPFLLAGLLSIINVPHDQIGGSLKYLLRPILFSYLMWLVLPYYLIETEKSFKYALSVIFWTGLLAALIAWLPLLQNPFAILHTLTPGSIFGFAPLTYNHNILAEVLVVVAPIAFLFFTNPKLQNKKIRKYYFLAFTFLTITTLLTFSRAAWIALLFELILYTWLIRKTNIPTKLDQLKKKTLIKQLTLLAAVLSPFIIYFSVFSFSSIVISSNVTRWDLTQISWTYFSEHPIIGNGVGTFVGLVADTRLFTVEYGDPLDAHGVIQKLLAEQGLLGLITFFIFICWLLNELYKGIYQAKNEEAKKLEIALFLAIAGSLIFQLFNTSYYSPHLWLPIGLALTAKKIYSYAH